MNWRHVSVSLTCLTATVPLFALLVCPSARAVTVDFGQVDWGNGSGGYDVQNSDWGQATVGLSLSDAGSLTPDGFGGYYGYVNIVTDVSGGSLNNWAVQNLVVYFNDVSDLAGGSLPLSVNFSLGQPVGLNVSSLNYNLTLTTAPLAFQPSGPTTFAGVSDDYRVVGTSTDEFNPGSLSQAPARNYFGAPAGSSALRGGSITGNNTNVPAINESVNACAVGSVARSLGYLSAVNPSVVITQTPQQVYAALTNSMGVTPGTAAQTITNGSATSVQNSPFTSGKNAYVASNGLSVANVTFTNTGLYGGFFGNPGSNALGLAISSLNATSDVEVWISWGTITNNNNSGTNFIRGAHQGFVTAIRPNITSSGIVSYTVQYIDDPVQGDGVASNAVNTMTILPDGRDANAGPNVVFAGVVGFFTEAVIPEPSTFGLTVLGAVAFVMARRRRDKR